MAGKRVVPDAAAYGLPDHVPCPFCETKRTELHSPFGPQLSVATYWCHACRTAFDFVKWAPRSGHAGGPPRRGPADGDAA